jgi:hypothetical protein
MCSPCKSIQISSVLVFFAFFLGCSSMPDEELKLAQQSMDQAKKEEAAVFASGDWTSAEKAWNEAQTSLKNQRYSDAKSHLSTARSRFEKALKIAKANREAVRQQVMTVQTSAGKRLSVLREVLASSKIPARSQKEMSDSVRDLESMVDKLNTELLNDQIAQARSSGEIALQKLGEVEKKMAATGKKPAR